MICIHAKKTGRTCSKGFSFEISCPHSATGCIRHCSHRCDFFEIDDKHLYSDYTSPQPQSGVGSEVHRILETNFGIKEQSGCGCDSLRKQWDRNGVEWAEQNIDALVDVMVTRSQQYKRLKLVPKKLLQIGAKQILRRAIKKSRQT